MRRFSLTARHGPDPSPRRAGRAGRVRGQHRIALAIALTSVASLFVATTGAQAVVIDMSPNATGQLSIPYSASDQSAYYGVALVPGKRGDLVAAGVPTVTSSAPCIDPALASTPDLGAFLPSTALCSHGGAVMHGNETFALTWDPGRAYWETTRGYVEQFLSDVAAGSGTLTSPYAVTGQYTDTTGRAANASLYGGGCIDYGILGGSACKFGTTNGTGAGNNYPANGCPVTGTNQFHEFLSGAFGDVPNDTCVTDAQLRGELTTMVSQTQTDVLAHTKPGYTPVVVLLTPPGVEVCLDGAGKVCSANGTSSARFCSYHSQIAIGGIEVAYVVQPWTATWDAATGCVEPDVPPIPANPEAQALALNVGSQLVSPLSQGQIAAIVNPGLNGWFAINGSEINDNGCMPLKNGLDKVTVGSGAYFLQREFSNAGVLETDPNALSCAPSVGLVPTFVVPSDVNRGDVVEFDGSTTLSSLIVAKTGYVWSFGDGTPNAIGPSVVHTYAAGGSYTVTLTVTDRGGDIASLSQTTHVLGPPGPAGPASSLRVHLQLMPEGLSAVLRAGLSLAVSSNEPADGLVTISITRSDARRAHIRVGRGPTVIVGRGTVSSVINGTVNLRLRLSRVTAARLRRLRHVTLTVRLTLADPSGGHIAIDASGRY